MAVNAARKVDSAKARRRKALETAVVYGVLCLLLIIIAAPVIFALIKSTQTSQQVLRYPPMLTFGRNALSNFSAAWSDYGLGRMMLNSGFIAIVGSTGKIVTALFGALAFVYFEFPGKKLWFYFVLLTLMLPMPVIIVPLFNVMAKFGWVNTYYSLTIPYLASATGIFLFQQHFMSIPNSIVGGTDGWSGLVGFLVKILVPMSRQRRRRHGGYSVHLPLERIPLAADCNFRAYKTGDQVGLKILSRRCPGCY